MAGGSGERFWPLSRIKKPKQLLDLSGKKKILLEQTIERFSGIIPKEDTFVVTSKQLSKPLSRILVDLKIPHRNILAEPYKRNTTGCLIYASALVLARYKDSEKIVIGAFPSDHIIVGQKNFINTIKTAYEVAERYPIITTIGILPHRPETGYGYIEIPKNSVPFVMPAQAVGGKNLRSKKESIYWVVKFREKPSKIQAKRFIRSGRFFWNSGMFFFSVKTFLTELEWASPALHKMTLKIADVILKNNTRLFKELFYKIADISIDYSLLEKARHIMMVKGNFGWNDLGAWDVIEDLHRLTKNRNINVGNNILIDVQNSIIYNEPGQEKMAVCAIGLKNTAIVVCKDAVLVVPKNRAQDVGLAVKEMKKKGFKQV